MVHKILKRKMLPKYSYDNAIRSFCIGDRWERGRLCGKVSLDILGKLSGLGILENLLLKIALQFPLVGLFLALWNSIAKKIIGYLQHILKTRSNESSLPLSASPFPSIWLSPFPSIWLSPFPSIRLFPFVCFSVCLCLFISFVFLSRRPKALLPSVFSILHDINNKFSITHLKGSLQITHLKC